VTTIKPIPDRSWEDAAPEVGPEEWDTGEEVPESAMKPLLGGRQATIGPAQPEGITGVYREAARKLKEAIFGHPDRAEARAAGIGLQPTPAELGEAALAGGSAMLGGATMGGLAAGPTRAALVGLAKGAAKGYAGAEVGEGVGRVAEGLGAPEGTSTAAGVVGGIVGVGPRRVVGAIRSRLPGRAAAAEAAPLASDGPRTLRVPPGMRDLPEQVPGRVLQMPQAPTAAQGQAEEVLAKITSLREKGLSGAQIVSSIRQLYPGYKPSEYQKMVDMVIKSSPRVR
jgi:hypothetical protein